jgi:hypothetical protein
MRLLGEVISSLRAFNILMFRLQEKDSGLC